MNDPTRATVPGLAAELERLNGQARDLCGSLSEAQINWRPDGRAWSVGQCVDHLSRSNRIYLGALAEASVRAPVRVEERDAALAAKGLGGWFVRLIEPPPRSKLPIPLAEMSPPDRLDREAVIADFVAIQARVLDLLRATADRDLDRVRFRNPMAKRLPLFSVSTGFLVIAAHERRHLFQAARVRDRGEFPLA